VVFSEVDLERIVVDVILLLPTAAVSTIADVATLVLVPAMGVELVITIKTLTTEAALRVSLETALVDGTRIIVAEFLVLP
jgi:alkylated DNA nucleotide flippase Atl1